MAMSSAMEPEGKRASRDTQLEVDVMILDYLLYMAAKQVIAGRKAERSSVGSNGGGATGDDSSADMPLIMVNCEFRFSFLRIEYLLSEGESEKRYRIKQNLCCSH
jgi:hypothetical protein